MRSRILALSLCGLLLACGGQEGPNPDQLQGEIDSLQQELDAAEQRVQELQTARSGTTIDVLPVDIYFDQGSAALSQAGAAKLDSLADVIQNEYPNRPIRIEGYTDDLPVRDTTDLPYVDNWELSAARAAAVVRYFQWGEEMEATRFEVVGYGRYRPLVPNTGPENRAQNRRVRIAVLPEEFGYQPPDSLAVGGE